MAGFGGGGGTNPLFEPFYDSMRIAVPLVQQQRQLDAAKARQDQVFMAQKQELLQKAEQASKEIEVKTLMEAYKGASEGMVSGDPASEMRVRATASAIENALGRQIFGRDEVGEIVAAPWAKPTQPKTQYDIKDTDQGLTFIPKDPDSGLQAKPTGYNAPPKKWEVQPSTPSGTRQPLAQKAPIGYEPNPSGEGLRPIPGGPADKPQRGEQGTKPPKDHVFDAESGTMKLIEGSPTFVKQRDALSKDTLRFESINSKLDILEKSAEELINHPGLAAISGIVRSNIPDWLNQDATDATTKMDSLGSKLATQAISEMREASKTGGALGNTSDADILLLKSSVESLKAAQSVEQKKQSLENIIDVARGSRNRMERAFKSQWGDWSERTSKKPISNKSLDITTVAEDELKKQLGITK
jgi:hypothetical protein